jgi:hypothetical protein
MQLPYDPSQAAGNGGSRNAGTLQVAQGAVAKSDTASPAAVSTANPAAVTPTWVALLVASALAGAGILHHAIFRTSASRPRVRIERGRAEQVFTSARDQTSPVPAQIPPAPAASCPTDFEHASVDEIDSQAIEDRIRQILRAMERRAA